MSEEFLFMIFQFVFFCFLLSTLLLFFLKEKSYFETRSETKKKALAKIRAKAY